MPAEQFSGNRFARRQKRFERFRVYNLRYQNIRMEASCDVCSFLQYEKMFGNGGFVKAIRHSVPDSPRLLLLSEK